MPIQCVTIQIRPAWGAGGREFKSHRPDQNNQAVTSDLSPYWNLSICRYAWRSQHFYFVVSTENAPDSPA
jgi:hypothetical protein